MNKLYSEHPVMFRDNPLLFVLAILTIPIGVGIVILIAWYIKNHTTKFEITKNTLFYEEGIINKDKSEINIKNIRSVKVKQNLFNRMFGTGTINLYTAGDKPEISAHGMPNANRVREIIKNIAYVM